LQTQHVVLGQLEYITRTVYTVWNQN
jgi:hypothetical protein